MKVRVPGVRKLRNIIERGNPLSPLTSFSHEKTKRVILEEEETHDRTGQPVVGPQRRARPQKFIIGDDEAELELSLGSRSFLEEERVTAKSRPMISLIARAPSNPSSSASESPGKRSYGIRIPGMRTLRKRIERRNPLWAATQEPHLAIITNNLLKALS